MERRWRSRSRGPAKAKANVAGRWGKNGGKNDVAKKMAGDPKSNAVGPSVMWEADHDHFRGQTITITHNE